MPNKQLCITALNLAVIDAKVPVKEIPRYSNLGKRVEEYQRTAGVLPPQPYCASAVFTWFHEACEMIGAVNPLIRTGYCPTAVDHLKRTGRIRKKNTDAKPGDVIFYWMKVVEGGRSSYRFAHAGVVLKNNGDGTLQTVEANTNTDGGRDGDGVYFKHRRVAGTKHVVGDVQNVMGTVSTPTPKTSEPLNVTQSLNTAQMGALVRQVKVTIDGRPADVQAHSFMDRTYVGIATYAQAMKDKELVYGVFDGHTLTLNLITK